VIVHHLIAQGTIEERVLDVMQGKATVQEALLNAVKEAA
jgi:SNF2 family DNA or RNA helicase